MTVPTSIELRATVVTLVAGMTGTRCAPWEPLVGDVERLDASAPTACNLRIAVSGSETERQALDAAIALLRDEHPHVQDAPRRASAGA